MVKKILNLFYREYGGLHKAALILAVSSIVSAAFGILRDRLLAGNFGAGESLDIYYAAFKIRISFTSYLYPSSRLTRLSHFFWKRRRFPANRQKNFWTKHSLFSC